MSSNTLRVPPFSFAQKDFLLAPVTYYRVGGPASWALFPTTVHEALTAYQWILKEHIPCLVLGRGSNVLIADTGFNGVALFTTNLSHSGALGSDRYHAEAGIDLDVLVREVMLPNNYDGVGALAGIPGSVGGAIFMNAGTVNGTVGALLESVTIADASGLITIPVTETCLGYRSQRICPSGGLIVSGIFQFKHANSDQNAVYRHYIQRRKEKQPQGACCGSVFKNPANEHAGRLIEACGLKGTRHGGAVISSLHANFIMNEGGASSEDILALIQRCKTCVLEKFGILLEEEVRIIRS